MSKTTCKKRLTRIAAQPVRSKPVRNVKQDIAILAGLAADGMVSAETMAKVHAGKGAKGFNAFDCCTVEELRRMLAYCEDIP